MKRRKNKRQATVVLVAMVAMVAGGCSDPPLHTYTHEFLLPMTPIKDQGKRDLCWAYAMLATIETEHILRGDSVNLSGVYLGRMLKDYQENVVQRPYSEQAMGQTALNLLQHYGVVGYEVLPDDATDNLKTPENVFMLGAKYTPLEFAHSVCAPGEYIGLTCFPDSPYYQKIDVPIPDNWEHNRLLNIPADTLRQRVDRALQHRHPVCYETLEHAMTIVGMAHDEDHNACYVMKNSWGTNNPYYGLFYIPVSQAWEEVVAVYMTCDAYEGK